MSLWFVVCKFDGPSCQNHVWTKHNPGACKSSLIIDKQVFDVLLPFLDIFLVFWLFLFQFFLFLSARPQNTVFALKQWFLVFSLFPSLYMSPFLSVVPSTCFLLAFFKNKKTRNNLKGPIQIIIPFPCYSHFSKQPFLPSVAFLNLCF